MILHKDLRTVYKKSQKQKYGSTEEKSQKCK